MSIDRIIELSNFATAALQKMKSSGGIKSSASNSPDLELMNSLPSLADECPKFHVDAAPLIKLTDRIEREAGGDTAKRIYTVDGLFDQVKDALDQLYDATKAIRDGEVATHPDMIDLDQAAALVNRSKATLRRALDDPKKKMPRPTIRGGGGRKNEWYYHELKPWLENEYGRKLPPRPHHITR